MDLQDTIITAIELHDAETINDCFEKGFDPNSNFRGEPLIFELTSEYARTSRFKECVLAFIKHGLQFEDRALLAVLNDDVMTLKAELATDPGLVTKTYSLRTAYTPIYKAGLLHICAEFNHTNCAALLISRGADINAAAGKDEWGFGGQSPVFHTVNQNNDNSSTMLDLLLQHGADLNLTIAGLTWGKTYPWETFIPGINPISYCMMGLLPQMHRNEHVIASTISKLLQHGYGISFKLPNIPNAYLQKR